MAHDHVEMPALPFHESDYKAMRGDDVHAAKVIGSLTGGIFTAGLVLYLIVFVSVWVQTPIYSLR
jgi:hypothetical protein